MKNKLLTGILLLFWMFGFSQPENYWSADLGLNQTHKGFFKLYDGIIDFGTNYNQKLTGSLYGGAGFYMHFISRTNTSARTVFYNPKANLHYIIRLSGRVGLIPQASVGYSFVRLSNKEFNYTELQSGINTSADLRVQWFTEKPVDFYAFGRFDYTYLRKDTEFSILNYYRNIYLTSFGAGIRIKPGKNEK